MNKHDTHRDEQLQSLGILFMRLGKSVNVEYGLSSICTTPVLDKVLHVIGTEQSVNIKTIASLFMITSGAATQHVAALEKMGLAKRSINEHDRREICVRLTKSGHDIFQQIEANSLQIMRQVFEELSAQELDTFIQLIRKASKKYESKENT